MVDFIEIGTRVTKNGIVEVYPRFILDDSTDLMIRGRDFYAIWLENENRWSTKESDAIKLIDSLLDEHCRNNKDIYGSSCRVLKLRNAETGMIDAWHKYCQKQRRDSYHTLDEKLMFANDIPAKTDYASKKLPYALEPGNCDAYDRLMSVLYSEEERKKIEWAIGAVISGDSKKIQKFLVLYGAAGTGKSTVLNIIQKLFDGYYSVFDAKALGSSNNTFALEAFTSNPLVAIQHDGDLSRIEDNTRLNSLVSHELMTVNEKFKATYSTQFKSFLFVGTNKPVKITDAKSGLIRRLIDVSPSGEKVSPKEYHDLVRKIDFELGAIAYRCLDIYKTNPGAYDYYTPMAMMGATNDFYNFVEDSYYIFKRENETTLKAAWGMYQEYCDSARVQYPFTQRAFKEELKNYFRIFKERHTLENGDRVRNYYGEFRYEKFDGEPDVCDNSPKREETPKFLMFEEQPSPFDDYCSDCPAQYATDNGTPKNKWDNIKTVLSDLDTSKLHYVKVDPSHIVIDFDIRGEDGNKNLLANIEAASKWPATYGELSKSGCGIHLHYIYSGDVSKLSAIYSDNVEIKVFTGNSSLRRLLSKNNGLPIAKLNSGLPLKGGPDRVINQVVLSNEKALRTVIKRNLAKEIHPNTKPSVDMIFKVLNDAYTSGMNYDVSDMRNSIFAFAAQSTHQADACMKLVNKMKFKSDNVSEPMANEEKPLVFFDCEVYPNLFLVNWKYQGLGKKVTRMINPSPSDISSFIAHNIIGYNNKGYDNDILYARMLGYTNDQLFELSKQIINEKKRTQFAEAKNISYTDIYDFAAAGHKQSLKKWEIELAGYSEEYLRKKRYTEDEIAIIKAGTTHKEMSIPWDQPVPEEQWEEVAEYCDNDVIAAEATFTFLKGDWAARKALAKIAGGTVNDSTNNLTTKLIFGANRRPQNEFVYTDLSTIFPGYKFENGVSSYRDVKEVGEGGNVWANPGVYYNVVTFDVTSMHPSSIIALNLFGDRYTSRFKDLVDARKAIKHRNWDLMKTLFGGAFAEYVGADDETLDALATALKTAINSVYGLTAAHFTNPFRDPRNIDNIVAKRGALFMINLRHEIEKLGGTVVHIKTDSIKIENPSEEIIAKVHSYGAEYGYSFDIEAEYERICLVNNAVYIAKEKTEGWTATGTQFAVPYVFKTLFSKEPVIFRDYCETKSVQNAYMSLDMNEAALNKLEKDMVDKGLKIRGDLMWDPKICDILKSKYPDYVPPDGYEALHSPKFVGRVGSFCPMREGAGGGWLIRNKEDALSGKNTTGFVTGTKGYRWLESSTVQELNLEYMIDHGYFEKLANDARNLVDEYARKRGSTFEEFVSDDDTVPFFGPGEPFGDDSNLFQVR